MFLTQAGMKHYAETDRLLSASFGVTGRRLDGDELIAVEPALRPGLAGGWLYERDAHLRPDRLMASWQRVLAARGVTVREGCAVQGILRAGGRARAVVTTQGEMAAEANGKPASIGSPTRAAPGIPRIGRMAPRFVSNTNPRAGITSEAFCAPAGITDKRPNKTE